MISKLRASIVENANANANANTNDANEDTSYCNVLGSFFTVRCWIDYTWKQYSMRNIHDTGCLLEEHRPVNNF